MKAFQLKIVIKGSKPPIWRRCIVPAGITFSELAVILNKVMGWYGSHLSEFEFYHLRLHIVEGAEDLGVGMDYDYAEASSTYIREYLEQNDWFSYTYDLGDCWDHRVTVEKVLMDYQDDYPLVIKFKGACPIEDSGGIGGYYECLEILADQGHPEYEERLAWAESQGYEPEYDMVAVNEMLVDECYLVWGKGETRSQAEIYEDFYAGNYGLAATKKDKNKAAPVRSQRHTMEDSLEEVAKLFRAAAKGRNVVVEPKSVKLADVFRDFEDEDLLDIVKLKGLKGIDTQPHLRLVAGLAEKMLARQEMERYFSCLSSAELRAFEDARDGECYYEEGGILRRLYGAAYIGVLGNDRVLIPADVYENYLRIRTTKFEPVRRRRSWLVACLDVAEAIYGVVSPEVIVEMFNKGDAGTITVEELLQEFREIPSCFTMMIYKRKRFYHRDLFPDDRDLVASQGDWEFYIPSREEIADVQEHGYFADNMGMKQFIRYLIKNHGVDPETARVLGGEVQGLLRADHDLEVVMDMLLYGGLEVKNERDFKELAEAVYELRDQTRMLLYRGATPAEVLAERGTAGMSPQFSVIDGGRAAGVVQMPVKKEKKIYPNDPCPCGSGKKFKVCCGRKK